MTWTIEKHGVAYVAESNPQFDPFWQLVVGNTWEPETFDALATTLAGGGLYIDIGAWIGPTALFAAHFADRIAAIEPDPVALAMLARNLAANPALRAKTSVTAGAVAGRPGWIDLYSVSMLGDSATTIAPRRGSLALRTWAIGIDEFLDDVLRGERHCVIKIDVEGSEYELVPALCASLRARQVTADLLVSTHGDFFFGPDWRMPDWAANLEAHGRLMAALAGFGTVHLWSGAAWAPADDCVDGRPAFATLADIGGFRSSFLCRGEAAR